MISIDMNNIMIIIIIILIILVFFITKPINLFEYFNDPSSCIKPIDNKSNLLYYCDAGHNKRGESHGNEVRNKRFG